MNNQEKNTYVKKQITQTLLKMMETEDFNDIVVSTLTKNAGVGRASFYRNFESKEDVLRQAAKKLMMDWAHEYETNPASTPFNVFESLFNHIRGNSSFYMALYKANLSNILLDTIKDKVGITSDMTNAKAYENSFLAYGIFGWVNEWIHRGMPETGAELNQMLAQNAEKNQLLEH